MRCAVTDNAHTGAQWRAELGLSEPSAQLDRAIGLIDDAVRDANTTAFPPTPDAVLAALADRQPSATRLERLTNRVLRSAIEQRQARQAVCDDLRSIAHEALT